jgi:hypothetical protein
MILRDFQASFGSQATGFEPLRVLLASKVRAWGYKMNGRIMIVKYSPSTSTPARGRFKGLFRTPHG